MEFKLSGFSITIDDVDALSTGARAGLIHLLQLTDKAANSCIAHEDRPDVGKAAEPAAAKPDRAPRAPKAAAVAEVSEQPTPTVADRPAVTPVAAVEFVAPVTAALVTEEPARDFAAIFGGAAASSVPLPPPPPPPSVPMPTPPAPPAAPACSPASAPEATAGVPQGTGTDTLPVLGAAPAVDSTGLPWDFRIHANSKGRTNDGAWRKRKNLDPSVVEAVEAELRTAGALPKVDAPPAAPDHPAANFSAFMGWIGKQIAAGALTHAATFDVVRPYGLQSLLTLGTRPDLLPAVHAALVECMAATAAGAEQVAA